MSTAEISWIALGVAWLVAGGYILIRVIRGRRERDRLDRL